ncbi:GNAT family N-acetyltransferase [bacterium]|nr:GNAT family N-acetyltransferase [bacterium]
MPDYEIVDVTADNLGQYDLFCQKSKAKEKGYKEKVGWFRERSKEGLKIKLLMVDEGKKDLVSRGFIEYTPAEHGWRVVDAPGYMLIHCIWVVGKHKKKGYGARLLKACIKDAEEAGKKGVTVIASDANWLPGKKIFINHGFEIVDKAPAVFDLLVKRFTPSPPSPAPSFPADWEARLKRYPKGLTILRTRQCPYTEDATGIALKTAKERNIEARAVELATSKDVQTLSPSAYGVFSIVYNGNLLSYHYLLEKDLAARLDEFGK